MTNFDINFSKPSQQQLNDLLIHYQSGRYVDAEKLSISLTKEFPYHQFAWKVLGTVLKIQGRINESLAANQKSIQLAPKDAEAHNNLGITLQALGKFNEAKKSYQKAKILNPNSAEVHNNLGITLQTLGEFNEAKKNYYQAITLKPKYTEAYYNLGITLQTLGEFNEAKKNYYQAITLKPKYTEAYYNLGITLQALGKFNEAEKSYWQAITLKPNYIEAYNNISIILKELGKLDEAESCIKKIITLKPDYAEAHYNLGIVLKELDRLNEAEASYKQALILKPNYADAYNNLGVTLQALRKFNEAETSYRQAITLKPDFADAYLNLCELLEKSNKVAEALIVIKNAKLKVIKREADFLLYEALILFHEEKYEIAEKLIIKINKNEIEGKRKLSYLKLKADIYHYRKNYNLAFETFNDMNESIKNSLEFKKQDPETYFKQQKKYIHQIEQLQRKSSYRVKTLATWLQPTFLIGFPRSGTTLLDTILSSHSKINIAEEKQILEKMERGLGHFPKISMIEEIDNNLAKTLSDLYLKELQKHCSLEKNNVAIDKLPLNILKIPLINKIFPKSKLILAVRHPFDCVMSCWMQNFKMNAPMANMVDLDRVVEFYCTTMKILHLCEVRYELYIHKVSYENLVFNFEEEVSIILQFLNLKWEKNLKNYQTTALKKGIINTPSYSQVVKPIYKTSSYRWKDYEKYLEPYKAELAPWLKKYKYLD